MTVSRLQPYAVTIFAEMSALAARIGAVNLGQGFPDEDGPPAMLKTAENAIAEGVNQYPPGLGIAPLREAIAAQRKRHFGTEYDPDTEVLVTVGATEAIAASVLGLVEPGSEVLLIEPFYDSYSPVIAMAGCERRAVPMMPDGRGFAIDVDGLRRAVTPQDQGVDRQLAAQPDRHGGHRRRARGDRRPRRGRRPAGDHRRGLRASGVRRPPPPPAGQLSRAWPTAPITISSAAKMFNCTGWKIGWACGAAELIAGVRAAKQYLCYVGGAPFQPAVAHALNTEEAWVAALRESLQAKRDRLGSALAELGFEVHDSFGTYFLCADPRPLGYDDSTEFCAQLPERAAWRRSRCPRSATRAPTTPTRGITWCASPSASATRRSTRRSGDWRCCATSRCPRGSSRRRRRCRPQLV